MTPQTEKWETFNKLRRNTKAWLLSRQTSQRTRTPDKADLGRQAWEPSVSTDLGVPEKQPRRPEDSREVWSRSHREAFNMCF